MHQVELIFHGERKPGPKSQINRHLKPCTTAAFEEDHASLPQINTKIRDEINKLQQDKLEKPDYWHKFVLRPQHIQQSSENCSLRTD